MKILNTENTEHYKWGANSDGWHLLKSDSLSVIEENVPPMDREQRHFHANCQQFFYVLSGIATIEISGEVFEVHPNNGIHIPAGKPHQLINNDAKPLRFLVISQPASHGDRVKA